MELNYHARTVCCTVAQSMVTEHVGVRFNTPETADEITAVLLISVFFNCGLNLAKVNIDIKAALQYLQHLFTMNTVTTIPLYTEKQNSVHQDWTR